MLPLKSSEKSEGTDYTGCIIYDRAGFRSAPANKATAAGRRVAGSGFGDCGIREGKRSILLTLHALVKAVCDFPDAFMVLLLV